MTDAGRYDWNTIYEFSRIDVMTEKFMDIVNELTERHAPLRPLPDICKFNLTKPWFSTTVQRAPF